jgi:hypothetical protein
VVKVAGFWCEILRLLLLLPPLLLISKETIKVLKRSYLHVERAVVVAGGPLLPWLAERVFPGLAVEGSYAAACCCE